MPMAFVPWAFLTFFEIFPMIELSDLQAEAICGASGITIAPKISISTSLFGSLQTNNGANVGIGVLGGKGISDLSQGNGLSFIGFL